MGFEEQARRRAYVEQQHERSRELIASVADQLRAVDAERNAPVQTWGESENYWPETRAMQFGDVPLRSSAPMRKWRAEQEEAEAKRAEYQAREQAESEQRKQHAMTAKMQSDASWNAWADRKIADALDAFGFNELQTETIGAVIAELREEWRAEVAEQVGLLRAELSVAKAAEKTDVVTLPRLPLRRRDDAA